MLKRLLLQRIVAEKFVVVAELVAVAEFVVAETLGNVGKRSESPLAQ